MSTIKDYHQNIINKLIFFSIQISALFWSFNFCIFLDQNVQNRNWTIAEIIPLFLKIIFYDSHCHRGIE